MAGFLRKLLTSLSEKNNSHFIVESLQKSKDFLVGIRIYRIIRIIR